jgi:hypothetical protein
MAGGPVLSVNVRVAQEARKLWELSRLGVDTGVAGILACGTEGVASVPSGGGGQGGWVAASLVELACDGGGRVLQPAVDALNGSARSCCFAIRAGVDVRGGGVRFRAGGAPRYPGPAVLSGVAPSEADGALRGGGGVDPWSASPR